VDSIAAGIERIACIAGSGQPGSPEMIALVLEASAAGLDADAVFVSRIDGQAFEVEHVHDRASTGLHPADRFDLHDQFFGRLGESADGERSDGHSDPHFESLVLGSAIGVRACIGVPLYRSEGDVYGRICAIYARSHEVTPPEITLLRLAASIVVRAIETAERRTQIEALRYRALHDPLTNLPNRALLLDRLEQTIRFAERARSTAAVLLLDLDGFKAVNDSFGHSAGDTILSEVGPRLRRVLRESDTLARLGGDEFVVVLPDADARTAALVARKMLRALNRPFTIEGGDVRIWGSIGISVYPRHGTEPSALMGRADVAMYAAKRREGGYSIYGRPPPVDAPVEIEDAEESGPAYTDALVSRRWRDSRVQA